MLSKTKISFAQPGYRSNCISAVLQWSTHTQKNSIEKPSLLNSENLSPNFCPKLSEETDALEHKTIITWLNIT